jgi:hypothetical protein
MARRSGGTKPASGARPGEKYQDGARKGGGTNTNRHAGPGRTSKMRATGTKGAQLQKRTRP